MSVRAYQFFATPLVIAPLTGSADLVEQLGSIARERRQEAGGEPGTEWQSDSTMLDWGGKPALDLLGSATALADQFVVDIDASAGEKRFAWAADLRAHFAGAAGLSVPPFFPGAYWSILMVTNGSGHAEVAFEDPRLPMIQMEEPWLRIRPEPEGAPVATEHRHALQAGELVMCPAWLRRTVSINGDDRALLTLNLTAFLATTPTEAASEHRKGR
jgi:hypothetical protein